MAARDITSAIESAFPTKRKLKKRYGQFRKIFVALLADPMSMVGISIVTSFFLMAIFAPELAPPAEGANPYQMPRESNPRLPPLTDGNLLGTTLTGGDLYYGIIWGSRYTIAISLSIVSFTTVVGTLLGAIAGYVGGWIDEFIMRIVDGMISIPGLVWAIAVVAALGPSVVNIIIAFSTMLWGGYARIMRAEVMHVKNEHYVDAAEVTGENHPLILLREVVPNAVQPIFVQSTLDLGKVVLSVASLSFIGLAPAGIAEWGVLISQGQQGLLAGRWWASFFPGVAIFLWAIGWNMIGDRLRDILDPQTDV